MTRPPTDFEIESFQQLIGNSLPEAFVALMKRCNGLVPNEPRQEFFGREVYVQALYSLKLDGEPNLFSEYLLCESRLPYSCIPIGLEGRGSYIYLNVEDCSVYFELDGAFVLICEDFQEFFQALGNSSEVSDACIVERIGSGGDYELFECYLLEGGDLAAVDVEGRTIGQLAVIRNERRILERYISEGGGMSRLLHSAMRIGAGAPMIDYLLEKGADPSEVDQRGKVPLDYGSPFSRRYLMKKISELRS